MWCGLPCLWRSRRRGGAPADEALVAEIQALHYRWARWQVAVRWARRAVGDLWTPMAADLGRTLRVLEARGPRATSPIGGFPSVPQEQLRSLRWLATSVMTQARLRPDAPVAWVSAQDQAHQRLHADLGWLMLGPWTAQAPFVAALLGFVETSPAAALAVLPGLLGRLAETAPPAALDPRPGWLHRLVGDWTTRLARQPLVFQEAWVRRLSETIPSVVVDFVLYHAEPTGLPVNTLVADHGEMDYHQIGATMATIHDEWQETGALLARWVPRSVLRSLLMNPERELREKALRVMGQLSRDA